MHTEKCKILLTLQGKWPPTRKNKLHGEKIEGQPIDLKTRE